MRKRQLVKSLGSNHSSAVNRLANSGMLFEKLNVKPLLGQQSCGETTGWPTPNNDDVMH